MKKDFLKAAVIRAIRTGIQTVLSMLTVGQAITDVNWIQVLSVTLTAMLISLLTAILTGLPEAESDGAFLVADDFWTLQLKDKMPEDINVGDRLTFEVKPLEDDNVSETD